MSTEKTELRLGHEKKKRTKYKNICLCGNLFEMYFWKSNVRYKLKSLNSYFISLKNAVEIWATNLDKNQKLNNFLQKKRRRCRWNNK